MVYLQMVGYTGEEVYRMRPLAFKNVYRAVKRLEVERTTLQLYTINQAVNGDSKSINEYISTLDIWSDKPVESKGRLDRYRATLLGKPARR